MIIVPTYPLFDHLPKQATSARVTPESRPNGGLVALALARANPHKGDAMASSARQAAGRAAWNNKSATEKARIRARLAAGRSNLSRHETAVIEKALASGKRTAKPVAKPAKPAPAKPVKPTKRPRSAAQLANDARLGAMAASRRLAPAVAAAGPIDLGPDYAAAQRRMLAARGNVSKAGQAALRRLVRASKANQREYTAKSVAARKKNKPRNNGNPLAAYIATRANGNPLAAYIATRANPKRKRGARRSKRRMGANKSRRNMYITRANKSRRNMYITRANGGMETVKTALLLTGFGVGGFMVTNVVQHYVGQLAFAKGPVAEYGVPAALAALVWFGPTGKMLGNNPMIGKHGQIALTAGILGAVVNNMLAGSITNNIAKYVPVVGPYFAKVMLGWPLISDVGIAGVGEYVYDLPDSGMGEYISNPHALSVGAEMKGLAYVDLQQRAANEAALRDSNIRATQATTESSSQFDDQFTSAY